MSDSTKIPKTSDESASDRPSTDSDQRLDTDLENDESAPTTDDTSPGPTTPSTAVLEVGGGIQVNGLQSSQISVLQEQHARGLIDVQRKASELKVDIQALDQTLESLTSQARTANDAGVNITATHTQNTSLGQTEIIVGNTPRAAAGKVAPVWSGLENPQVRTGLMIAGALLVGALLASLFS